MRFGSEQFKYIGFKALGISPGDLPHITSRAWYREKDDVGFPQWFRASIGDFWFLWFTSQLKPFKLDHNKNASLEFNQKILIKAFHISM